MRVALEELLSRTKRVEIIGAPPRRTFYPSNGPASLPLQVSQCAGSNVMRARLAASATSG